MGRGSRPVAEVPPWAAGVRVGLVVDNEMLAMGESAAFMLLRALSPVADATFVALHPLAFAGWLGFFFTALNLFPVSQLDGGHVAYALSPRVHRVAALLTLALLVAMGFGWAGWWFGAFVVLVVGRGRVGHAPGVDPHFALRRAGRGVRSRRGRWQPAWPLTRAYW
jgi:membrane-associated protease RseP (regulator of RpoE activity)